MKIESKAIKTFCNVAKKVMEKTPVVFEWDNVTFSNEHISVIFGDGYLNVKCTNDVTGAIDFGQFSKYVATIKEDLLISKEDDKFFKLHSGKSKFTLAAYEPNGYSFETVSEKYTLLQGSKLKSFLPYLSKDELRMAMTGVYFDADKDALIATNAHYLLKMANIVEDTFIMHPTAVKLFSSLNVSVSCCVVVGQNKTVYRWHLDGLDYEMCHRNIDAKYPDWFSVVPQDNDIVVLHDTKETIAAIKEALPFAPISTERIVLDFDKKVVSTEDIDFSTEFETEFKFRTAEKNDIGKRAYNGKFLMTALGTFESSVLYFSTNYNSGTMIVDGDNFALVMPIVLN